MYRHLRLIHPKVYRSVHSYIDRTPMKGALKSTGWIKRSWVKKYCTRVSRYKYRCRICQTVLSLINGAFGNMKRHIKSKHPYIYEKEIEKGESAEKGGDKKENESDSPDDGILSEIIEGEEVKTRTLDEPDKGDSESDTEDPVAKAILDKIQESPLGDVPFLKEDDPEFMNKVKYLVNKQVSGRTRAKNCIWNFFNVVKENSLYSCLTCNRQIAISACNTNNMKRHIRTRHKYLYSLIMKFMVEGDSSGKSSPVSFDKHYFNSEGDNEYKCKECDTVIMCTEEDQQTLFDHIKDTHPEQIMAYHEEWIEEDDEKN